MSKDRNTSAIQNLYCVEYPGNVQNADRMIETLGGINTISNIFNDPQRKLELRYRPDDKFCKAAIGERCKSSSFVLKVVVKRKKSDTKNAEGESVLTNISVVGKVLQMFKFCNLNDFQYLPMEKNADGQLRSIYNEINPRSIVSDSWFYENSPLFLPPAIFSRTDSIQPYLSSAKATEESSGLIGRHRDRRSNYVRFVNHDLKEVPTTPNPLTLRYINLKLVTEEQILRIRQLFEERPVWTKSALQCNTKYAEVQLKYLLALSSYHFTSGPFRISWVRFGYDPRKDVSARKYQTLDYRLRSYVQSLLREQHPDKYQRGRTKTNKNVDDEDQKSADQYDENNYIYKPGVIPPQKQIFYQVCDLQIPEIQEKLNSLPTNEPYHSLRGWLTEEFLNFVRETIDRYVLMAIQSSTEGIGESIRESKDRNSDDSSEDMEFDDVSDQDDSDSTLDNDDL